MHSHGGDGYCDGDGCGRNDGNGEDSYSSGEGASDFTGEGYGTGEGDGSVSGRSGNSSSLYDACGNGRGTQEGNGTSDFLESWDDCVEAMGIPTHLCAVFMPLTPQRFRLVLDFQNAQTVEQQDLVLCIAELNKENDT